MKKQPKQKKANWVFFDKINRWFIYLFLLLLPTQLGKYFFFPFSYLSGVRVDYLAPTIFLTDILVIILVILNIKSVLKIFSNKWVAGFLLLLVLGGFFAQSTEIFLYRLIKIIELLCVFAIFKYKKISPKAMFLAFFCGAVFGLTLVILQFINKHSLQGIFYFFGERYLNLSMPGIAKAVLQGREFLRPYGTFSHPNSLAGFYLLIYAFFLNNYKVNSWLKNIFLAVSFLIILFSFSKTALIVLVLVQTLYLVRKEFKDNFCLPCVVSKILLFAVPIVIFTLAKTDPLSLEKRFLLVQNSLALISHHLFLGVGLGNYLIAQARLPSSLVSFPYQPVHNIFLLFSAETGLISVLFLAYFGLKKFLSVRRNAAFVACCLVMVLTGLLDHYWLTLQQNFLLMGVIFGAFAVDLDKTG